MEPTLTNSIAPRKAIHDRIFVLWVICFVLCFWTLRVHYWWHNEQPLFSDMQDFENIARGILRDFNFSFNSFYQSYTTPTLPFLRAFQIYVFGDSMRTWQYFQTVLLFGGLTWLCCEMYKILQSRYLALSLFALVTFSRPSIFWSLKFSREGLGEAFVYLSIAACLTLLRKPRLKHAFVAGFLFCAAMMIRGSYIFALPFLILLFILPRLYLMPKDFKWERHLALTASFLLGMSIIWAPWIARSYRLYGHPVFLTTMSPYSFFWDLGTSTVVLEDGSKLELTSEGLQNEAPGKFKNDYEASQYAKHLAGLYLQQNLEKFPRICFNRALKSIEDPEVHLTTVSRWKLHQRDWVELLLFDKNLVAIVLGSIGLLLAPLVLSALLWPLLLLTIIPWLNAAMVVGYARMLEPFIPIILFGNVLLILCLFRLIRRWVYTGKDTNHESPI